LTVPYVGDVVQRNRPQPMFCVSVKLWTNSDIPIWDPEDLRSPNPEVIWNIIKGTDLQWLGLSLSGIKGLSKTYVYRDRKGSNPLYILFKAFLKESGKERKEKKRKEKSISFFELP